MAKAKRDIKAKKGGKAKIAAKAPAPKKSKVTPAPKKGPKVSPAAKLKKGPVKPKKAERAGANRKVKGAGKVKKARPKEMAAAGLVSTTIPYQGIAIRWPWGTDADPSETVSPTFTADGTISPFNASAYARVFSGSTAISNQQNVHDYVSGGQWSLPAFEKSGGGNLDPGTYGLRVWMADDSVSQEITIVIPESFSGLMSSSPPPTIPLEVPPEPDPEPSGLFTSTSDRDEPFAKTSDERETSEPPADEADKANEADERDERDEPESSESPPFRSSYFDDETENRRGTAE